MPVRLRGEHLGAIGPVRRSGQPLGRGGVPAPALKTANLLEHWDMLQGADPDVVYGALGAYNGTMGSSGSNKPTRSSTGIVFSGAGPQYISFPTTLSNLIRTDLWIFSNTLKAHGTGFHALSEPWLVSSDGRPHIRSDITTVGSETWSPANFQTGNVCFLQTYGSGGKIFWGRREAAAYLGAGPYTLPSSPSTFRFGYNAAGGSTNGVFQFSGTLFRRACWSVQLTDAEATEQMDYFTRDVRQRGVVVGDTTSTTCPNVACFGDSVTAGVAMNSEYAGDWPLLVREGLVGPVRVTNFGVGGAVADASFISARLPQLFSATSGEKVAVIAWGINMMFGGGTVAAAAAAMAACVQACWDAGADRVVVVTCPRAGSSGTYDTRMQAFNALLVAGIGQSDTLDQRATGLGDAATTSGPNYTDTIHHSRAGQQITANLFLSAAAGWGWS